jgi:hypothetical protein
MELIFRKAKENDIDCSFGLLARLFTVVTDFAVDRDRQKVGLFLLFKDRGRKAIFAAENKGVVICLVTCQLVIFTAVGGYAILLEDMFIDKLSRHNRIRTSLIQMVQKWWGKGL